MKLNMEWSRPLVLKDGSKENLIYTINDPKKLPKASGIYVLGRRYGKDFEALYVGKGGNIQGRVKNQFKNLPLMMHLKNAKSGKRVVIAGKFISGRGQNSEKCIGVIEKALIRYFLSEGHDLVNKHGTRLRRHEISSKGKHPKKFIPKLMYVDKTKGG